MKKKKMTKGKEFDSSVKITGHIGINSTRLILEKPYELTRFEYSILKKSLSSSLWFSVMVGATAGIVIAVIAKSITALISKQSPSIEIWEIVFIIIGIIIACVIKYFYKSEDEKEKIELMDVVNNHFKKNQPRGINMKNGDENEN